MTRKGALLSLFLLVAAIGAADAVPPAAAWQGLVGLFTAPTAETFPPHEAALTFSEIRFRQDNDVTSLEDKWFVVTLTYVPARRWEVAVSDHHEITDFTQDAPLFTTRRIDETKVLGHVKYIIEPVAPDHLGLAVGALDVGDETAEWGDLDTGRGRRVFLVGTYNWLSLGITNMGGTTGVYGGAEMTVTDNVAIIAELSTSPVFITTEPKPTNRLNFNFGLRIFPREVDGLRADIAAVGDGEFDLGFSFSYRRQF